MQDTELIELVRKIQSLKCETQTIEIKTAEQDCPKKLYDTLSSFSNQDDGGIIVFGISEPEDYKLVGVYDPQDLQKKVTEQCKQMEPVVRALFSVCEIDGKIVVAAEIPSVDISERPVFYKGVGRIKGSFIRVGDSDEPMSEYEIYSYDAFRKRIRDDIRVVSNSKISLFNKDMIEDYINRIKKERRNLSYNVTDEEILELMGVTADGVPTLAGVMTFSKYPQGYFPQLCITAIRAQGLEIGESENEDERFIDNRRITGSISEMLDDAVDFVRKNSRCATIIDENGKRDDRYEYPLRAVREAVLNALVHRDYSMHTENVPIRIQMFSDRMEIISSGGLYGRITIDSLGKVRPDTRNTALANMLEILHITENRYSGIPTIQAEFRKAGLPAPIFSVKHGEFTVTFKNNFYRETMSSSTSVATDIVEFCSVPRSRVELQKFTGYTWYYTSKKFVQPLLEKGVLKMTMPDKPKSSKQKYVKA